MDSDVKLECEKRIRERLSRAGAAGLTTTGLKLGGASSKKGKVCRQVLKRMAGQREIRNLGSAGRPRYVIAEHFKPLEIAYERIEQRAREAGEQLRSRSRLTAGLTGAVGKKAGEALRLLVDEGALVRLKWAGKPVFVHVTALPMVQGGDAGPRVEDTPGAGQSVPDEAAIKRAYKETVKEFGYPDVVIHEVYLRLGGELEPFKKALLEACRAGRAVPNVGDWSLSSPEERKAALYIKGHPHLRIRFKE